MDDMVRVKAINSIPMNLKEWVRQGRVYTLFLGMHYKNTKGMGTMPGESWPDLASTLGRKRVSTGIYAYGNTNEVNLKKDNFLS